MSFLETMSLGLCVVAVDRPTMNEYIRNGENGLLYDPANPQPLDFSEVQRLGSAARESCVRGNAAWIASGPVIREFLARPAKVRDVPLHRSIVIRGRIDSLMRKGYQTLIAASGARLLYRALRKLLGRARGLR